MSLRVLSTDENRGPSEPRPERAASQKAFLNAAPANFSFPHRCALLHSRLL